MKKFEVGKEYSMTSVCDHNCVWTYTVTARTAQTITISDGERVQKCRINKNTSAYRNAETVYPLGQYSMCPSLAAAPVAALPQKRIINNNENHKKY